MFTITSPTQPHHTHPTHAYTHTHIHTHTHKSTPTPTHRLTSACTRPRNLATSPIPPRRTANIPDNSTSSKPTPRTRTRMSPPHALPINTLSLRTTHNAKQTPDVYYYYTHALCIYNNIHNYIVSVTLHISLGICTHIHHTQR